MRKKEATIFRFCFRSVAGRAAGPSWLRRGEKEREEKRNSWVQVCIFYCQQRGGGVVVGVRALLVVLVLLKSRSFPVNLFGRGVIYGAVAPTRTSPAVGVLNPSPSSGWRTQVSWAYIKSPNKSRKIPSNRGTPPVFQLARRHRSLYCFYMALQHDWFVIQQQKVYRAGGRTRKAKKEGATEAHRRFYHVFFLINTHLGTKWNYAIKFQSPLGSALSFLRRKSLWVLKSIILTRRQASLSWLRHEHMRLNSVSTLIVSWALLLWWQQQKMRPWLKTISLAPNLFLLLSLIN